MSGGYGYAAILRDISSRVKAEDLLRQEQKRLGLALKAGHMGTFQIDELARIVRVDETAARLAGIEGAADLPLDDNFELVHPDDRKVLQRLAVATRAGTGQSHGEFRITRPDGTTIWCATDALGEYNADGQLRLTTGVIYDITERKELERTLEGRVARRTQDLSEEVRRREEMQADLLRSQKLQAVGELAGGIAHDFNNLLTVISGNLELLSLRSLDHKARDLIRRATSAANMGARLSNRLLAFGRRQSLHPTNIDLGDIVNSMMEVLKRSLGATIDVEARFDPGLWPARADVSEVENAILNLAINARDAMPNGGKLVIHIANTPLGSLDVSGEAGLVPGEYVMLSVADNGVGISRENLPRVFEPYFTTKEAGRGTGLGLSTIYGFAKQSGGHVTIDSEAGHGTTVRLYLPRANGTLSTAETVTGPAAESEGETILVVEDSPEVREVTIKRLDMLGYKVLSAEDAPTAIGILKGNDKVDLVFSDVVMPGGMTGFDLVKWVRANRPAIRLLLTSGFTGDISQNHDAGEANGVEILRKPYATTDLARALRHALT
jgi:PAS domain S-box-containing protein